MEEQVSEEPSLQQASIPTSSQKMEEQGQQLQVKALLYITLIEWLIVGLDSKMSWDDL